MILPMGRITRDYLRNHRLCPHQCAPNMFKVLGCVDALNNQMNLGLTWHDVVHLYECHSLSRGCCLKSQSNEVRLISCLPKSNKGMKDDFLIVSRGWHDGLPYPEGKNTRWGSLGPGLSAETLVLRDISIYIFYSTSSQKMFIIGLTMSAYFGCFADKEHISPKISCVNVPRLNFLLRLEIFVSKDRQLQAAHLILGYKPLLRIYHQDAGPSIESRQPPSCSDRHF